MKIFVTWPKIRPEHYWRLTHKMNGQIAYHLLHGLRGIYGKHSVFWADWQDIPSNAEKGDIFIKHPAMRNDDVEVTKKLFEKGLKLIFFGNTGCNYNSEELKKSYASVWKTNDIILGKWNSGEVETDLYNMMKKRNLDVSLIPHPMDKERFNREVFTSKNKKMLILGSKYDARKRSKALRKLLGEGNFEVMDDVHWHLPKTYKRIIDNCSYVATYSKFEGFPYFLNEGAYKGLLPIGLSGYWHGYGHDEIVLGYGSDKDNQKKLHYILNNDMEEIYQDVLRKHTSRYDHTWEYALKVISEKINKYA